MKVSPAIFPEYGSKRLCSQKAKLMCKVRDEYETAKRIKLAAEEPGKAAAPDANGAAKEADVASRSTTAKMIESLPDSGSNFYPLAYLKFAHNHTIGKIHCTKSHSQDRWPQCFTAKISSCFTTIQAT